MAGLHVLARTPLPEPLTWISPLFAHDGWRAVVLGESGRLWVMEIDPAARAVDVRPLPVTIQKRGDGDWLLRPLAGSHALDRLLVWTDRMRVHALPSGDLLHEQHGPIEGEGAACLTPSGRTLLCVEEERAWSIDLDSYGRIPRETWVFHQMERESSGSEFVLLDHVDTLAVHPLSDADPDGGDETFWLAMGCYGFVLTQLATMSGGYAGRGEGKPRVFGGLVYDPTELARPFGARHLFVLHGHRCGLAALDPATGERHDCVLKPRGHPYGYFREPATSVDSPIAIVQCGDGAFLWEPGVRLKELPAVPGQAWKVYGDDVLCAAGGELLWMRLPERP